MAKIQKISFMLFAGIFISLQVTAQKGLPGMGKIDKADLEMKDCDFDKGAEAMVLIDWGNIFYRKGKLGVSFFNTVFEKRLRIKVLKEGGLSNANVTIPYFDEEGEEQIKSISAYSYNLDAAGNIKVTEVGKSSIYSKRINKQYSEMIIAFPEAKVGTVVEFKYSMERQTMGHIKDWYFQGKIPTRYSEYQIDIPLFFHFVVHPSVVDKVETKDDYYTESIVSDNGTLVEAKAIKKNYVMRNLPGIRDEPFMGSPKDYMQRLEFQLSQLDYGNGQVINLRKSWGDVIKELMHDGDFGSQLDKKIRGTEDLINKVSALDGAEVKIKTIYDYVRKEIGWNGEARIYSLNGVVKTLENKSGNSGDINLLLVNLLTKAGLDASPILLSTRDNGILNNYNPFVNQFNTVMAYVQLPNKYYVLDATDKASGYKLTPESVVNTKGFVVTGKDGKWKDLAETAIKYKVISAVKGVIDVNGVMKGECTVNCDGYAKVQKVRSWIKDGEKFKEEYFTKPYSFLKVDELEINNATNDSLPLEQKVRFTYPTGHSGEYHDFKINLFSDLEKNPFISEERHSDIDFGVLQDYMLYGNFTIPDGYRFEELPPNVSMIMPDTSIMVNRYLQAEDNLLNVRITVSFKRSYYLAADYGDFAAFYKKMMGLLNEPVLFRKK